jgi:photosystem II stability/assembly factor-like uncharacterized protein
MCALAGALSAAGTAALAGIDPERLAGIEARSVGPAGMSGRVTAIEALASDPDVVYVGTATGGVWKSSNGGLTWAPMFDDQPVAAIGAVAVAPSNPDIVWVGTGEGNPRNSASVGDGVYRSLDAGETWAHVGLEGTERIHRIVVHPDNADVAWVAALGQAWGENSERGVYKTVDGGKSWDKVLFVDERTGAADLVIDPSNPDKLIAAMWDYRRWPWFFRSGGPGSGMFVTLDGGDTWTRLTERDGLPPGELGRIGVAFCRTQPKTVYALVEAETSALIRSDDGGTSWVTVNRDPDIAPRPFYFADIRVDPEWPQRVYSLWSLLTVSNDGGKTFHPIAPFKDVHPDHHAMWIDPADPRHIIAGNDGGVAISADRGATWRFVPNLPVSQFYHVAVDYDLPYHIFGGMQDNGSWRGPGVVWENGGIRNYHWNEVDFGDGFDTRPDPKDSMAGYAMSQEGYLRRFNLRTGVRKDIRPSAPSAEVELRFNWNSGLAVDPFEPATLYYGSQFVHRSTDRGESWSVISGDLTANDPERQKQAESGGLTPDVTGAENFATVITIAPSPVERGVLWVGTDDGRIQVTRDGGKSWSSVEDGLGGVPAGTWVPAIEASPHDGGTAFVVLDNHRRSDWKPYVYRTTNYGRSWKSLASGNLRGYALSILQDPVDPDVLFLGTEFGLYLSLDGGGSWLPWKHGVPTVSVMDLALQPRENDLVVGTHGRGAYVIDDISPLRAVSEEILDQPIHVFGIANAQQYWVRQTDAPRFPGHGEFRGTNRPYGALITFSLNEDGLPSAEELEKLQDKERRDKAALKANVTKTDTRKKESKADEAAIPKATIVVRNGDGETIRKLETPVHRGVNRAVWDLRRDPFREPPRERRPWEEEPTGPEVLPGVYTVNVAYGAHDESAEVRVLPDPRIEISSAEREAKWKAIAAAGALQETVAKAVARIVEVRSDALVVTRKIEARTTPGEEPKPDSEGPYADLTKAIEHLNESLDSMERELWIPPDTRGIVAEKDCFSKVSYVRGSLQSSWDEPTATQLEYLERAEALLDKTVAKLNDLFSSEVVAFRKLVTEAGFELVPEEPPLEVPSGP